MERAYPFTPDEFKEIYSRVPRLTIDIIIQTPKGILLTFRQAESYNNMWHLPGGTVYYNEKLEETVNRIAKEELGIKVEIIQLVGIIQYTNENEARGFGHAVSPTYLCKPKSLGITLDQTASKFDFLRKSQN